MSGIFLSPLILVLSRPIGSFHRGGVHGYAATTRRRNAESRSRTCAGLGSLGEGRQGRPGPRSYLAIRDQHTLSYRHLVCTSCCSQARESPRRNHIDGLGSAGNSGRRSNKTLNIDGEPLRNEAATVPIKDTCCNMDPQYWTRTPDPCEQLTRFGRRVSLMFFDLNVPISRSLLIATNATANTNKKSKDKGKGKEKQVDNEPEPAFSAASIATIEAKVDMLVHCASQLPSVAQLTHTTFSRIHRNSV